MSRSNRKQAEVEHCCGEMMHQCNMHIDRRHLTWFLMPLFLTGVICNGWKVEFQQQHMCAVKGSSVVIPCSFPSPGTQRVKRVMWGQEKSQSFISDSNSTKVTSRFQYIGDTRSNCSLKIHQVEKNDAGKYSVRFFADKVRGIRPALTLNVVALKVSVTRANGSRISKEGDSVNLTCINPCEGNNSSSAVTWFKNGELLHEVAVLYLNNMSNTNSGNYTCSLKTQPGTISEVVNIDVEYSPRNTSVSIMREEGSSNFTLICSSHANPPVKFYSWFKKDDDNNDMVVGHCSLLFSGEGGQYFCNAANKHGSQNSSVVIVKIKAYWTTLTRDVLLITTAVVLLIVTSVIVITRLKKKRAWEPKMDCREDVQDTDYVNWLPCDNNQSQEGNQREEGTELIYATVDLINRESNIGQQMDSCKDDQSVIYSTVCRHQMLNPSNTEAS